jgi:hypothetical protein
MCPDGRVTHGRVTHGRGRAQHCQRFEEALLTDFLASFLEHLCTTSEVKLGVAARGRAVAAEYLRSLAA